MPLGNAAFVSDDDDDDDDVHKSRRRNLVVGILMDGWYITE